MTTQRQSNWHLINKQWLWKCFKVSEDYIAFNTEQAKNKKSVQRQKPSFPKEYVENNDLSKPVLSKTMTTHE